MINKLILLILTVVIIGSCSNKGNNKDRIIDSGGEDLESNVTDSQEITTSFHMKLYYDELKNLPKIAGDREKALTFHKAAYEKYELRLIEEAHDLWYQAALSDPSWGRVYYNLACMTSLLNENTISVSYVALALHLSDGELLEKIIDDSDLDNIRPVEDYKTIVRLYLKKAKRSLINQFEQELRRKIVEREYFVGWGSEYLAYLSISGSRIDSEQMGLGETGRLSIDLVINSQVNHHSNEIIINLYLSEEFPNTGSYLKDIEYNDLDSTSLYKAATALVIDYQIELSNEEIAIPLHYNNEKDYYIDEELNIAFFQEIGDWGNKGLGTEYSLDIQYFVEDLLTSDKKILFEDGYYSRAVGEIDEVYKIHDANRHGDTYLFTYNRFTSVDSNSDSKEQHVRWYSGILLYESFRIRLEEDSAP
ncbi:MAG: hypothetical protein GY756_12820 [bacterium]|nr:hypothetical protein [bacterium]